jgi:hypothetical protein
MTVYISRLGQPYRGMTFPVVRHRDKVGAGLGARRIAALLYPAKPLEAVCARAAPPPVRALDRSRVLDFAI